MRQRLQTHGTLGQLRARLRAWQKQIDADSPLRQTLSQLPVSGWPTQPLAQAPLLAAYLLAHWILAGLQQGQGYGFPLIARSWRWPAGRSKSTPNSSPSSL